MHIYRCESFVLAIAFIVTGAACSGNANSTDAAENTDATSGSRDGDARANTQDSAMPHGDGNTTQPDASTTNRDVVVTEPQCAPGGVTYPGYTYQQATSRPFISLQMFADASLTSAAYLRLKSQVDDAVRVTNGLAANATYDDLTNALNSDHYGYSAVDSVVLFRMSNDPAYIRQAIRMMDLFVTAENQLISGGHAPVIAGDSYLDIGDILEQLALTYDYGYSMLSAGQRTTWETYANQALQNLWSPNPGSASWGGWSGWATGDPGDNYHYSFVKATQLWSLATQNNTMIAFLQSQKYPPLVHYFSLLCGGGSREGTGYGTSMMSLFEDYSFWKASTGEDLSALSPHARDTIDYWIHATVPTLNYFAPIGDQARSSMTVMFDYQRRVMLEAVALAQGSPQAARGLWWLNHVSITDGGDGWVMGQMRYNFDFRYDLLATAGTETAPTDLVYHATGAGVLFARSSWDTTASWLATVAGIYDQSHAHQDQGSFTFYKGTWLAATNNMYSHSGINQGVEMHSGLRFQRGSTVIGENHGEATMTTSQQNGALQIHETLTPVYSSSASDVQSWTRDFTYQGDTLRIQDACMVSSAVRPTFQVQVPVQPTMQSDGSVMAGNLLIHSATAVTTTFVNMHTVNSDVSSGWRVDMTTSSGCAFDVTLTAH